MEAWATFWGAVLALSVTIFAAIVLVVTIGGARDIRSMLRQLGRRDEEL